MCEFVSLNDIQQNQELQRLLWIVSLNDILKIEKKIEYLAIRKILNFFF
jgi:hypothetical protein